MSAFIQRAYSSAKSLTGLGVYIQMYRGHPADYEQTKDSNVDCRRAHH
jgi:hypothetical protein